MERIGVTFLDWAPVVLVVLLVAPHLKPPALARSLVARAQAKGDADAAVSIAARYAGLRPGDPSAWISWAHATAQAGGAWGTVPLLRRGRERNPGTLAIGIELADALINQDDYAEAHALLENLRAEHPEAPGPMIRLARLAGMAGNDSEATSLIDEVRALLDPKRHAWDAFELALTCLVRRDFDAARQLLEASERHLYAWAPHMFLALLSERDDPTAARRQLAAARYYWTADRRAFGDEWIEARKALAAG